MNLTPNDHTGLIDAARRQVEAVRRDDDGPAPHRSARSPLSDSLPGYCIDQLVHRGGQGAVYRAVQASTGRTVAVKMMRDRPFAGAHDHARFEREVQILGQLDHPNIVRIIDSGQLDGQHYFVMDFIDGVPLDAYGETPNRQNVEPPKAGSATRRNKDGDLALNDKLLLFAGVCDAVHAAHLRGVIHRDLKPGNILVDSHGRPHVLDFGLAKLFTPDESDPSSTLPPTVVTETGQFLGSLPWASPEQVSGDAAGVDIRSDVYSLGVILYQMLTGAFPYRVAGSIREVTDNILTVDPTRPSTVSRQINDEVETIVLKTLNKEPERRYQSAGELARDIRHYLSGELIEAKRDSIRYVLRKQLRRHWIPATVALAFVLVVTIGLVVAFGLWQTAAEERDQMQVQRAKAESVNHFLNNMLVASANPEIVQGKEITVRHTLDEASRQLEAGELGSQLDVEATVRLTLGRTYAALGEYAQARAHLNEALAIRSRLVGEHHPDYAQVLLALASVSHAARDIPESIRLAEHARAVYETAYAARGGDVDLATCLGNLAEYVSSAGEGQRAIAIKRQSLDMLQRLFGDEHEEVIMSKARLAAMLHDPVQSEPLLREALETSLRTLGETHPQVARLYRQLGGILVMSRKHDEALQMYTRAVALYRQVVGEQTRDTLHCQMDLAFAYRMAGDHRGELDAIGIGVDMARQIYGEPSYGLAELLLDRADGLSRAGDAQAAEADNRQALSMLKAIGRDQEPLGGLARLHIACHVIDAGDPAEAESLAQEVLAFLPDQSSIEQWMRAYARAVLGAAMSARGERDFQAAEDLLLDSYGTLATNPGGALLKRYKRDIARWLVELYESWDTAEPGTGKAEQAATWRGRYDEVVGRP